ncbi:MAG: NAD(P)-dependent oxidoreductase, partial [Chthonomonadales bacterium]
ISTADHVVLSLPLTDATRGFFGQAEFAAMKPTAHIYNVGRGPCIVKEALFLALDNRTIAGAGLDVTDPEPLPPDDPHWFYPNVILSQHSSGYSPNLDGRLADIFIHNLNCYRAGKPLLNLVDFTRGY